MAHKLQLIPRALLLVLIFSSIKLVHSQPLFTYTNCSITPDTYASNSKFHNNLEIVLSNLTFAASTSNFTFFNSSFGQEKDVVYGLYLCRGDLTQQDCSSCINNVTKGIIQDCPNKKESIKWVQQCTLRYANRNIFSKEEESPFYFWRISAAVKPPENAPLLPSAVVVFNLTAVIYDLINGTAFGDYSSRPNKRYFLTREDNVTGSLYPQTIYSLAQCTPDISQPMCQKCLRQAYTGLRGSVQSLAYLPSCHLRYDLRRFYNAANETNNATSPQPSTRVPSPSGSPGHKEIAIGVCSAMAILLLYIVCFFIWKQNISPASKGDNITMESLKYDIRTIKAAVNNFHEDNQIGKGGFAHVFRGRLENGQEIAVKRLVERDKQANNRKRKGAIEGLEDFKTEVLRVAKLQHKNLVRLLGYCLTETEKLLIFEYLPRSSLDGFLFNPEKRASLNWETRYMIIDGVAKGLLYLHEDSRYKIVHRDLKPANILLDKDMTPKISDFGLAKLFGEDQAQNFSQRIAGTRGYVAPEYGRTGIFSLKSDVYSFGVIVLEIVSGRGVRERQVYTSEDDESLLEYAWRLWNIKELLALLDPALSGNFSAEDATRCIHIALSCIHIDPQKRPTMASVVSILNSYSNSLPQVPPEGFSKSDNNILPKALDQSTSKYSGMEDITTLIAR